MTTGKSEFTQGLEVYRSARNDDDYTPPKQLGEVLETREVANKRLAKLRDQLSPIGVQLGGSRIFHPQPANNHVSILVDRRHPKGFASGMLNIRRDGRIDIGPVKIAGIQYIRLLDGRLVETDAAAQSGKVFDFLTKQPVMQLPPLNRDLIKKRFHKFFPKGCLLYRDGTLSWYRTTTRGAIWEMNLEQPLRNLYPMFVSSDHRYLAINNREGKQLFDIYSLTTGKPIVSIARPEGTPSGYSMTPNFSGDGKRLGATVQQRFHIYEIPSGTRLLDERVPHDKYHWHVTSVGEHWVIGSDFSSSIYHAKTGWRPKVALANIFRATEIRCLGRQSLLVESRHGLGAVVDLETGKLQAKWYVGKRQGPVSVSQDAPHVFKAFDDKLLIRRVQHAAEIELIDVRTLAPIAKVHPVPVDGKLGWIISTSDGYWDASPGAEKFVAMYNGLHCLTPEEIAKRRNSAEIQSRISALIRR